MGKVNFKPGNMIYPIPAVMVSVADKKGNDNILTVAWTGTLCTNPPMAYICVRPERHSHKMIMETGEFVINLTTEKLAKATDYCGVKSGNTVDKFEEMNLTREKAQKVKAPLIAESPVNIECKVRESKNLGSHTMFIADVIAVTVDDKYMNSTGKFDLNKSDLLVYSHGEYFGLGDKIGKFGYSVDKKYVSKDEKVKKPAGKSYGDRKSDGRNTDGRKPYGKKTYGKREEEKTPYSRNEEEITPYSYGRGEESKKPYGRGEESKKPYGRGEESKKPYGRGEESKKPYGRGEESKKPYGRGSESKSGSGNTSGGAKKSTYKKKFGK